MIGLVLCCVPFPPTLIIGLAISGLNLWLWNKQKLGLHEGRIVKWSIAIGSFLLLVSSIGFYFAFSVLSDFLRSISVEILDLMKSLWLRPDETQSV
jgi:hypothetical protein